MLGDVTANLDERSDPLGPHAWRRAVDAGGIGVWQWDLATGQVHWSRVADDVARMSPDRLPGTIEAFFDLIHPEDRSLVRSGLEAAIHGHQPQRFEVRLAHELGDVSWVDLRAGVIDDHGDPVSVVGTIVDIGERKEVEAARERLFLDEQASRAQAEAANVRLRFLASASREVRAVLDPVVVRRTAVDLLVPSFGDWALILDTDGRTVEAISGATESCTALPPRTLRLSRPLELVDQAAGTGDPRLTTAPVTLELVGDDGVEPAVLEATSVLALRLVLGASNVGILVAGHGRVGRPYQAEDLELFGQFAESVAATIVKATLFQERSAIARVLQQSLLPASFPAIPGVEIGSEYLPIGEGLIVGGDFYDVFRVSEGRYGFAIGDVSGKGSEAAAVTAMVRHSIRAFAEIHDDPADLMVALNEAIRVHSPSPRYCTVAYGLLTIADEVVVRMSVGGHPLPLVLRADGSVEPAGSPGTLLGAFPDVDIASDTLRLEPGDTLMLYTDGVVESRRAGIPFGETRLRELLRTLQGHSPPALAARVASAVAEYQDDPSDDLAVLAIRCAPLLDRGDSAGEVAADSDG